MSFKFFTAFLASCCVQASAGAQEIPITLLCAADEGQPLFDDFNDGEEYFKISDQSILRWSSSQEMWITHPCYQQGVEGSWCSVTPTKFEAHTNTVHPLVPSSGYLRHLSIDRTTGEFSYSYEYYKQTPPFYPTKFLKGVCKLGEEPQARRKAF